MKKVIVFVLLMWVSGAMAQEYTVLSRDNREIKMYPGGLGKALKAMLPIGGGAEPEYRLIKKVQNGQESLLFVDFSKSVEKVFVTYETDMVHPGRWGVKIYTAVDIYKAVNRVNAILLKGELLGMPIEIYQRPLTFQDRISIDSIEFAMPIKVEVIEGMSDIIAYNNAKQKNGAAQSSSAGGSPQSASVQPSEPEEVIPEVKVPANEAEQRNANDHFVAYLVKARRFNYNTDGALLEELCDNAHIPQLLHEHGLKYLEALGKYHDQRLDVCENK